MASLCLQKQGVGNGRREKREKKIDENDYAKGESWLKKNSAVERINAERTCDAQTPVMVRTPIGWNVGSRRRKNALNAPHNNDIQSLGCWKAALRFETNTIIIILAQLKCCNSCESHEIFREQFLYLSQCSFIIKQSLAELIKVPIKAHKIGLSILQLNSALLCFLQWAHLLQGWALWKGGKFIPFLPPRLYAKEHILLCMLIFAPSRAHNIKREMLKKTKEKICSTDTPPVRLFCSSFF